MSTMIRLPLSPAWVRAALRQDLHQYVFPLDPQPVLELSRDREQMAWYPPHAKPSGNAKYDEVMGPTPNLHWRVGELPRVPQGDQHEGLCPINDRTLCYVAERLEWGRNGEARYAIDDKPVTALPGARETTADNARLFFRGRRGQCIMQVSDVTRVTIWPAVWDQDHPGYPYATNPWVWVVDLVDLRPVACRSCHTTYYCETTGGSDTCSKCVEACLSANRKSDRASRYASASETGVGNTLTELFETQRWDRPAAQDCLRCRQKLSNEEYNRNMFNSMGSLCNECAAAVPGGTK